MGYVWMEMKKAISNSNCESIMRALWVGRHLFTVLKKKDEQRVLAVLIFFFFFADLEQTD